MGIPAFAAVPSTVSVSAPSPPTTERPVSSARGFVVVAPSIVTARDEPTTAIAKVCTSVAAAVTDQALGLTVAGVAAAGVVDADVVTGVAGVGAGVTAGVTDAVVAAGSCVDAFIGAAAGATVGVGADAVASAVDEGVVAASAVSAETD